MDQATGVVEITFQKEGENLNVDGPQLSRLYRISDGVAVDTLRGRAGDDERAAAAPELCRPDAATAAAVGQARRSGLRQRGRDLRAFCRAGDRRAPAGQAQCDDGVLGGELFLAAPRARRRVPAWHSPGEDVALHVRLCGNRRNLLGADQVVATKGALPSAYSRNICAGEKFLINPHKAN